MFLSKRFIVMITALCGGALANAAGTVSFGNAQTVESGWAATNSGYGSHQASKYHDYTSNDFAHYGQSWANSASSTFYPPYSRAETGAQAVAYTSTWTDSQGRLSIYEDATAVAVGDFQTEAGGFAAFFASGLSTVEISFDLTETSLLKFDWSGSVTQVSGPQSSYVQTNIASQLQFGIDRWNGSSWNAVSFNYTSGSGQQILGSYPTGHYRFFNSNYAVVSSLVNSSPSYYSGSTYCQSQSSGTLTVSRTPAPAAALSMLAGLILRRRRASSNRSPKITRNV